MSESPEARGAQTTGDSGIQDLLAMTPSEKDQDANVQTSPLLGLPVELRLEILSHLMQPKNRCTHDKHMSRFSCSDYHPAAVQEPNVFLVCRQLYREALYDTTRELCSSARRLSSNSMRNLQVFISIMNIKLGVWGWMPMSAVRYRKAMLDSIVAMCKMIQELREKHGVTDDVETLTLNWGYWLKPKDRHDYKEVRMFLDELRVLQPKRVKLGWIRDLGVEKSEFRDMIKRSLSEGGWKTIFVDEEDCKE